MHVVVGVAFPLEYVRVDASRRDALYPLSQVVVAALWRSNLAEMLHDVATGQGTAAGAGDGRSCHRGLLSVSFSCGAVMHVDQRLVAHMAGQHQAAPSEYQILAALEAAVQAHSNEDGACAGGPAGVLLVHTSGSGKAVGTRCFWPCMCACVCLCLHVQP